MTYYMVHLDKFMSVERELPKNLIDNNRYHIYQDHKVLCDNLARLMIEFKEEQKREREQKLIDDWADAFFARKR